eukprot:Lankesteria_metandrocarpae@DN5392_c0_g2_i1.p1
MQCLYYSWSTYLKTLGKTCMTRPGNPHFGISLTPVSPLPATTVNTQWTAVLTTSTTAMTVPSTTINTTTLATTGTRFTTRTTTIPSTSTSLNTTTTTVASSSGTSLLHP